MSSDATDPRVTAKDRVVFSSLFVFLLVLALFWPVPVLWLNELTVGAELNITSSSFLGREAPGWDVVYWGLVGLAVLALLHGRLENVRATWSEVRPVLRRALPNLTRGLRQLGNRRTIGVALLLVAGVAALWGFLDAPLIAQVERVGSTTVHDFVRISNRLGGGGNPPMIVGFFVLAGLALKRSDWVMLGVAMAISASATGISAGVLKPLVARSRPDFWLGPFNHAWGGESSFPSGHTIAAFAMAGAILAGSKSRGLKLAAIVLASSIAATRVIALRHWPSDVVASAVIGAAVGLYVGVSFAASARSFADDQTSRSAKLTDTSREQPASSIVTP